MIIFNLLYDRKQEKQAGVGHRFLKWQVAGGGWGQAAGGRRQAAGGRRQAAGGRRQAAGGRLW